MGLLSLHFMSASVNLKPISAAELKSTISKSPAPFVIVNFWASWCEPCREEFPELLKFKKGLSESRGQFILVSVDSKSEEQDARSFLKEQKVDFVSYIRSEPDQAFINAIDKKWSGALPTTFIFNREGRVLSRFDGEVTAQELNDKLTSLEKRKENSK